MNNNLGYHEYVNVPANAESPWKSSWRDRIQSTRGLLRRGSRSSSTVFEQLSHVVGTNVTNTHLKKRGPVDHSIWSSLGEDVVEARHEPTPKGIKAMLEPVLGSYGTLSACKYGSQLTYREVSQLGFQQPQPVGIYPCWRVGAPLCRASLAGWHLQTSWLWVRTRMLTITLPLA